LITGREGLLGLRRDDPPSIYAPDGKLRSLSVSIRAYLLGRGLVTDPAGVFFSTIVACSRSRGVGSLRNRSAGERVL
jgi:hypothetical protein